MHSTDVISEAAAAPEHRARALLWRLLPLWCVALMIALTPLVLLQRDLWSDEAYTVSYTRHTSIWAVLEDVGKNEETPPLSSVITWLWARVAGQNIEAVRVLSLLFGALAVALTTSMAQRLLSPAQALIAGVLMAASPLVGSYAIEGRGYTLTLLLGVCCIMLFERLHARPDDRAALVGYALAGAALLLTSYLGIALLAAHNLTWLIAAVRGGQWRRRLGWLAAQVFIGAAMLPWLPVLLGHMQIVSSLTPYHGVAARDYILVTFGLLMHGPVLSAWMAVWLLVSAACWTLLISAMLHEWRRGEALVLRAFGLPAVTLLATLLAIEGVGPRYLMLILPGAAIGVARGWQLMRERSRRLALGLVTVVVVGVLVYRLPVLVAPRAEPSWSPAAEYVARHAEPGDAVLFQPPYDLRTFDYYYRGPEIPLIGARHYDDFYATEGHSFSSSWTVDEAIDATRTNKRVWLVQNTGSSAKPQPELPYRIIDHFQAGRVVVWLYEVDR